MHVQAERDVQIHRQRHSEYRFPFLGCRQGPHLRVVLDEQRQCARDIFEAGMAEEVLLKSAAETPG